MIGALFEKRGIDADKARATIQKAWSTIKAVKGVADKIKSFLGFSEPEDGPLSDFHTYMPDMIDLMTQGIASGKERVRSAVEEIAAASSSPRSSNFFRGFSVGHPADGPNVVQHGIRHKSIHHPEKAWWQEKRACQPYRVSETCQNLKNSLILPFSPFSAPF